MPKAKELPIDFDVRESWEELKILIESIDKDLKKAITKGTKRSGVNARKGLMYAKELISNIYHGSIIEQKEAKEKKPRHGNANGPGLKAMHDSRGINSNIENFPQKNEIKIAVS